MTDKDEPDIQDSGISNEPETTIQTPIPTEDEKLLLSDGLTVEAIDEPASRFAAPANNTRTNHKTEFEAEPTEVLQDEPQDDEADESKTAPDENALKPSWLRFTVICLLCLFAFVVSLINFYQYTAKVDLSWDNNFAFTGGKFVYTSDSTSEEPFQVDDELISINDLPVKKSTDILKVKSLLSPNERYKVLITRGNQIHEIEFTAKPILIQKQIANIIGLGIAPIIFILTGLFVFLLKPNDKLTNLLAVMFLLWMTGSLEYIHTTDYSLIVAALYNLGGIISGLAHPVFLHFFLIFPKKVRILHRYPKLEYLLYLPALLLIIPFYLLQYIVEVTQVQLPNASTDLLFYLTVICILGYILTGLISLILNYLRSDTVAKRKIRFVVISILLGPLLTLLLFISIIPIVIFDLIFFKKDYLFIIALDSFELLTPLSAALIPLTFSYAIVRHKIIPISFVIRRGLQYLLAKNALRLLLVLPILGIVWNITANPNRTLSEILLNNSFTFYLCIVLAAALVLLNRFGLREWVDRKFFREQYNQEKILRELTETVKESDSLLKLSRLVSSKIQLALHPENIYLFFRDDVNQSDFSLGYTTNELSEPPAVTGGLNVEENPPAIAGGSDKMPRRAIGKTRLAADSPLLRFMQQERGAIEFPTRQTDDLPDREKRWLREINANLLVPMHGSDGKLAGIFSLGEKRSQIPYTRRDKELLETLANQIALVHENLGLKDRMRREQKIKTEVLARFDEGNINLLKECPKCGKCFDRNNERCDREGAELTFSLPVERTIENRYRLEKLIGKGGMGAVYKATDLRINRAVAVKILSGAMFGNRYALRRFEREAQTAGKLNHRNIVTVFDYGVLSTEGAFLVMELVKGNTLSKVLKYKGKMDAATVVVWFAQVLNGLETAHKAGIIHRDLKPGNIFVTRNEDETVRLCILDFGLARFSEQELAGSITIPGTIMGTLGYMPPEQLRGEKADERSDLFATGVMIYEALHGERPYAGKTYQEITQSMSKEIAFEKDEPFANFFKRGLALKPEKRFASANEMKRNLLNSSFSN